MLCFTILSRISWQAGTVVVKVGRPESRPITHSVRVTGTIRQTREYAILTEPGQRVRTVWVQEGQVVSKGDLLLELDTDVLEETIRYRRQELDKLKYQMEGEESRKAAQATRKENEEAGAIEQYTLSTQRTSFQRTQAAQNLDAARQALWDYDHTQTKNLTGETGDDFHQAEIGELREAVDFSYNSDQDFSSDSVHLSQGEYGWLFGQDETRRLLQEAVRQAEEAYQEAVFSANEAEVTGERAVKTAGLSDGADYTGEILQITMEQSEAELKKLEQLLAAEGKLYASADGQVREVLFSAGDQTTDTAALLLSDFSGGSCFQAVIDREQKKYLTEGCLVDLVIGDTKKKITEVPISAILAAGSEEAEYLVTVQLPGSDQETELTKTGSTATLEYTQKSRTYPLCVPLSALHLDEKRKVFVLVPEEVETVMGTEIRARKVGVDVLEQNENYAALAQGSVSSGQDILVDTDRNVEDGTRIRIEK